ncbi:MAG TPA: DUF6616 family protein [Cyclobacteriaceae bacterium]
MKYLIDQWNTKDSRYNRSQRVRFIYPGQSCTAIQGILSRDVETVAWSTNDKTAAHKTSHNCYTVRKFPGDKMVKAFESAVETSGSCNCFDQMNRYHAVKLIDE